MKCLEKKEKEANEIPKRKRRAHRLRRCGLMEKKASPTESIVSTGRRGCMQLRFKIWGCHTVPACF